MNTFCKSRLKNILFLIAVCGSAIITMSDCASIPAVDAMYGAFSDHINLTNYIISGPALIAIVTALAGAPLVKKYSKKNVLILSYLISTAALLLCSYIVNVVFIAIMRTIAGLATGLVQLSAISLVNEYYSDDEKHRSFSLGILNAGNGIGGTVLSLTGGLLAAKMWHKCFSSFWLCIPFVIMMILWIPKHHKTQEIQEKTQIRTKFPLLKMLPIFCSFFIICMVYCVIYLLISVYIIENGIGDESTTGLISSLGTLASCVVCFMFGFIYQKLKRWTILPVFAIMAIGYFALFFFRSLPVLITAFILMSAAYGGVAYSYYFMRATVIVGEEHVTSATSIVMAANGISMFLSTYFATYLMAWMKSDSLTAIFPVLAVICTVWFVIELVLILKDRKLECTVE